MYLKITGSRSVISWGESREGTLGKAGHCLDGAVAQGVRTVRAQQAVALQMDASVYGDAYTSVTLLFKTSWDDI